jgi:hypothetical protein
MFCHENKKRCYLAKDSTYIGKEILNSKTLLLPKFRS